MYRAVALWARRAGIDWDNAAALEQLAEAAEIELGSNPPRVLLNGEDVTDAVREPEISQGASRVSAVGGVRRALVAKQRRMAESASVVMEGRDIATVVFPEADVKVFLDAGAGVRADRRVRELAEKAPPPPGRDDVLRELEERDRRDRGRSESPLVQAPDAHYLDSSDLTIDQVEEAILRLVRGRTSNGSVIAEGGSL
jgi:cytidylate kinase